MSSKIRLDKWLAEMGEGSRKQVRTLIRQGQVLVNGQIVKDTAHKVMPGQDTVLAAGKVIPYEPYVYLMMNKKAGVLSATEDQSQRTVIDLLTEKEKHFAPFPVGRLDKDTTGLLLITNDGQLAHELLSPKKNVPKTYRVTLDKQLDECACKKLREGVKLKDGYMTKPAVVETSDDDRVVYITIREGKYHQVKRMFAAVGFKVMMLHRIRMGSLELDKSLAPGEFRSLQEKEIKKLKEIQYLSFQN